MRVSAKGIAEVKAHEGVRTKAYQDQVGVWTIGVGHTAAAGPPAPRQGMVITMEEVDEILARDLVTFEKAVLNVVKVPLNQNQFDALVSLAFNIGAGAFAKSTLVRKLNAGDYQGAAEQFLVWNKAGGATNKGLVNRRAKEKALFLTPFSGQKTPTKATEAPTEPAATIPATPVAQPTESLWVKLLKLLQRVLK